MIEIEFCRGKRCCPTITIDAGKVRVGGDQEGVSTWTLGQFSDFVRAAKEGKFDDHLA